MASAPASSEAHHHTTLLRAEPTDAAAGGTGTWWTLPPDVLNESVRRIRVLAWLYTLVFFLAGLLPMLLSPRSRDFLFETPSYWIPALASIAGGAAAAFIFSHPRLSPGLKLKFGLAF